MGRSTTLDEELKIELAVNVHIRHRFINYDSLYSSMKAENVAGDLKKTARTSVYDQVKEIAQSWRGLGVSKSIMSSDVSKEKTGGLEGNKNQDYDAPYDQRDSQEPLNRLWPKCALPPQRRAAMVANLSFPKRKASQVTECRGHPATSGNQSVKP